MTKALFHLRQFRLLLLVLLCALFSLPLSARKEAYVELSGYKKLIYYYDDNLELRRGKSFVYSVGGYRGGNIETVVFDRSFFQGFQTYHYEPLVF